MTRTRVQTLQQAVYGDHRMEHGGRKAANRWMSPTSLSSASRPRVDYLPMWEMYGDHARGLLS